MISPPEATPRRSGSSFGESGLRLNSQLILLLINLAALVWGAAKISSTVEQLKDATTDLRSTIQAIQVELSTMKSDVNILKDHDRTHP